ncbi:MAG: PEGA domain-containing protein [Spirochaetales bacterium]|nr:PEGA domain-containing protein [Spirochaetales bacterium]
MEYSKPSILFIAFLLIMAITCFSQLYAQVDPGNNEVNIAFLGFNARDIPPSGGDILSDLVRNELLKSGQYNVIEREHTALLLEEIAFQHTDLTDQESIASIGNLLGVRKLMTGTIGRLGELSIITLQIIDVETGLIEKVETEEFTGMMEELRKPVRIAVQKILDIEGIEVDRGTYIHVASEPEGVNIYIDGLFEGSSPARIKVPGPGEYRVKLYAPGWEEWHQKVELEDNSTFFVDARLLKRDKDVVIDDRVRALQDGRVSFIINTTLYSLALTEALIYASGTDNSRLYFGLPLLITPGTFFLSLKGTQNAIMNKGRSFLISSSFLWGATMGITSGLVLLGDSEGEVGWDANEYWRPFAFASAAGGVVYGTAATLLTRGDAFPAKRVWYMNLGSFMGSLVGLGIPYMFNVENRPLLFGCMLTGSSIGGGLAVYLTRHIASMGANVENLSYGSLINIEGKKITPGLPILLPVSNKIGGKFRYGISLFHYQN